MTNEQKAIRIMEAVLYKTTLQDRKPTESEQMLYDVAQAYLQLLDRIK